MLFKILLKNSNLLDQEKTENSNEYFFVFQKNAQSYFTSDHILNQLADINNLRREHPILAKINKKAISPWARHCVIEMGLMRRSRP